MPTTAIRSLKGDQAVANSTDGAPDTTTEMRQVPGMIKRNMTIAQIPRYGYRSLSNEGNEHDTNGCLSVLRLLGKRSCTLDDWMFHEGLAGAAISLSLAGQFK